jgi:hypothetical protein
MMRTLRERNPEMADRKIQDAMPRMRWLIELREKDRALYDLRLRDIRSGREAFEAAREIAALERKGSQEDQASRQNELEGRLKRALEEQYDVRGQILAREIARMEEELGKRAEGRAPTVERMTRTLIDRAKDDLKEGGRHGRERRGEREAPEPPER